MKSRDKIILIVMFVAWIIGLMAILAYGTNPQVLNPKGIIADKEKNLIIFASLLSLVIVIPVFILTFFIAWRYREGNKKAKYDPKFNNSKVLESIWWGLPLILILILSVVTYKSSHDLDPFKPIEAANKVKPMDIQVVALQGKWLFIYPEQKIATLSYLQIPVGTPVKFDITSDAPMNSFWIPSLGGQIYAMNGMTTNLNIRADEPGTYRGSSANMSGPGFSRMTFQVDAVTNEQFRSWVESVKIRDTVLNYDEYSKLASNPDPSKPIEYSNFQPGLYDSIVERYSGHSHHGESE